MSAEFSAWLPASPSRLNSVDVRHLPHLPLGSLFEGTSNLQPVAISFRLGCIWEGPHFSALLAFHQHKAQWQVIQCPKVLQVPPPPASISGPAVSLSLSTDMSVSERASGVIRRIGPLDFPLEAVFRLQGRQWVCSPSPVPHVLVCPRLFLMSNNVQFLMSQLSVSCEEPNCGKGTALSYLVLM